MTPDNVLFRSNLSELINTHNQEMVSNTPDFVLAEFLFSCLKAYDQAVSSRDSLRKQVKATVVDLSELSLSPGDRLLVSSPNDLTPDEREQLRHRLREWFPDRTVLVLERGVTLSVLIQKEIQ